MPRLRRVLLHAILLGLVVVVGCKLPVKPMKFNNMMAQTNDKLSIAAKDFAKAATAGDVEKAREAKTACEKALSDAESDFKDIVPPVNAKGSADFLKKYRDFLKTQREIMDDIISPVMTLLEGNDADKWNKMQELLKKASDYENAAFDALSKAQDDYAKTNNFKLVD